MAAALGKKQALRHADTWELIGRAHELCDDDELDRQIDRTVDHIKKMARGKRVAYGWSGGKDSQALQYVMEQAGYGECVLGMSVGLEWPAMLQWQADYMPAGCEVVATPQDLHWLRDRPHMLFPEGRHGPAWFKLIQHRAQRTYYKRHRLDMVALGRRKKDGNFVGRNGENYYTNRHGITRWSPIADWTHEQLLRLIQREQLPMPPCYRWPRGFQIGTGAWPARQWTESQDHGWTECWTIDPDVVRQAAEVLPQAADWMRRNGLD